MLNGLKDSILRRLGIEDHLIKSSEIWWGLLMCKLGKTHLVKD